jgi:hypothetical protein
MFKLLLMFLFICSNGLCSNWLCSNGYGVASKENNGSGKYDKPFLSVLKKAKRKNKSAHNMPGIDFIYVIANKKCHRFNGLMRSFSRYGINPYRFTAFESKDISFNTMFRACIHGSRRYSGFEANRLIVRGGKFVLDKRKMSSAKEGYVNRAMSIKCISRALSHISIIKDAIDSGYEHIWIMDSGTELRRNPHDLSIYVAKANEEIPDWTSLYTDYSERDQADQLKPLTKFYLRPDVDFYDPNYYLDRAGEEEKTDAYSEDDSDIDKSCARNLVEDKESKELNTCQEWDQNHPQKDNGSGNGSGNGSTGPSDNPGGSRSCNLGELKSYEQRAKGNTRTRVNFTIQNKRSIAIDSSHSTDIKEFKHVGILKGAHSYILNRKGMKLIMDYYLEHKIFIPYAQEIQIIEGMCPYYIPDPVTKNMNKG